MRAIDHDLLRALPLADVELVTFCKRDEITTDLICCTVMAAGETWTFHEDMPGWDLLIRHLEGLPGFRGDWFAAVSRPPFATSPTLAYHRQ